MNPTVRGVPFGRRSTLQQGPYSTPINKPFQNPCRAFSFKARKVCLAFSLDWYSSNSHDLAHHDVHWIVAQFLRHGNKTDAVFRQLPDVEFQLEMVAEEPAEGMDDHHVKGGRLAVPASIIF